MIESQTVATPTKASLRDVGNTGTLTKGIKRSEKMAAMISKRPTLHITIRILYLNERTTLFVSSMIISPSKNCIYYIPYRKNVKIYDLRTIS